MSSGCRRFTCKTEVKTMETFDFKLAGRIILLSSDRLVRMVTSRAAAAVRQARRAQARLD